MERINYSAASVLATTFMFLLAVLFGHAGDATADQPDPDAKQAASAEKSVFASPLPGRWYPASREKLRRTLDEYFNAADRDDLTGKIKALLLPHAGYRFSGKVAAAAVKQIQGNEYDRVIIIGPSHSYRMRNNISVPRDFTHYKTPLGEVPLDTAFITQLASLDCVKHIMPAHRNEHSVQIELPLLQYMLDGSFKFVPIVTGQLDTATATRIAERLNELTDDDSGTLIVISSDFTHYGDRFDYKPFDNNVAENIRNLDMKVLQHMREGKIDRYYEFMRSRKVTVCGKHPIAILMGMSSADSRIHKLAYDTSGRMTGSYNNSVSYLALAVTEEPRKPQTDPQSSSSAPRKTDDITLSKQTKENLLQLARKTVTFFLEEKSIPEPAQVDVEITPAMKKKMGAFVTLHKNGRLRGCIGEIQARRALHKAVTHQAINAAFADKRFPSLRGSELDEITFEISALSPPHTVSSADDIVIGKHGIILEKNGRRAVYLPQVAPEQGWDVEETLRHLSAKAGLPPDAWKENAAFKVFTASIFSEH